jgi:hypothetical protein
MGRAGILDSLGLDLLLDVAYALLTEGMDAEQRTEFGRIMAEETAGTADQARRRAYALEHGEMG